MYMAQINFHTTPEFEADLAKLMKDRNLRSKFESIRLAVHEAAGSLAVPKPRDWSKLVGFIDRLPGGRQSSKTGAELEAEIDEEMEAAPNRRPTSR